MMVCDHKCFKCKHPDCIMDGVSDTECRMATLRDRRILESRMTQEEIEVKDRHKAWYKQNKDRLKQKRIDKCTKMLMQNVHISSPRQTG